VDAIPGDRLHFDSRDEPRLDSDWIGRHGRIDLASVGVMEWAGVVLAKPGVLKGVRVVDLVCLREEKPEVAEGLSRDKLELGKGVGIGSGVSEVGHEGTVRCFGEVRRPYGSGGVVETSWHC
jgi:hypothetical protein